MEEDPFDFESDVLLATSPVLPPTKRKKTVIDLDDLLVDHYKEKNRVVERASRLAKTKKIYANSDDEEDGRVAKLSKYVDECHEKMTQLSDEDDVSVWGLKVFGHQSLCESIYHDTFGFSCNLQKRFPSFDFCDLSSCSLFQSVVNHKVNSLVELTTESGETFFEGLLTNGWLLKLVCKCGEVEEVIAKWTFHLMLYSSKEVLRSAAVDFWCSILLLKKEGDSPSLKIDWLPSYSELKVGLENYGFLLHSPVKASSDAEMILGDSESMGPPQNIRAWIKFVAACSKARNMRIVFSTSEAEELVMVIICFMLDRQLLGLSLDLNECLLALVNFFTDDEWSSSCVRAAKSVALRIPIDTNSLRAVECISAVCGHTKQLRSVIAYQILLGYFDTVEDEEEVIRQLTMIDLKDKSCDLFKVYIYMVLTENWFLYNPLLKEKPLLNEMWSLFLRNCSCQINITDTRFAVKHRFFFKAQMIDYCSFSHANAGCVFLHEYGFRVEDEEELIRQLTMIDLKDKSCDLFKVYIYMVLTENWFLYNPLLKEKPLLNEMWSLFLRNCSCQINITDTRFAVKHRFFFKAQMIDYCSFSHANAGCVLLHEYGFRKRHGCSNGVLFTTIFQPYSYFTTTKAQPKSPLVFDQSLSLDALSSVAKEYIDNLLKENARLVKLVTEKNLFEKKRVIGEVMMGGDRMAKRSSFGKSFKKKLSDITNYQAQPKSPLVFDQSLSLDALSSVAKEYIDNLLKENARLVKLVTDKNKTIEMNGVELQKMRIALRKTQLQNWNLAQSNSQMMAEHNIGKQKLKELQHQLACKDALLKTMTSELQAQREMNDQKSEPKDVDNADANQQNANRPISSPMTTTQEVCDEIIADNVDTNHQKTNRRIRPTRSQSIGGPMTTTQHVSDIELTENKRRKVRRQSARFSSEEHEPNENLFEIEDLKMYEDGSTPKPECRDSQRMSLGRPSRRAAEKIQSYKETPLNIKMRRPE
ncbi:hypothetical protein CTI12_AA185830 [Artemisia annua]|uniref:Shugoshin C-terminal domain-containing protein n=1 Tax=Artemisia annua TaxID=35608 RepID=A0A2U1P7C7_ARTAN|nr:hypothetical protein CTI12_AA185830 [Artemisia annua]